MVTRNDPVLTQVYNLLYNHINGDGGDESSGIEDSTDYTSSSEEEIEVKPKRKRKRKKRRVPTSSEESLESESSDGSEI